MFCTARPTSFTMGFLTAEYAVKVLGLDLATHSIFSAPFLMLFELEIVFCVCVETIKT